MVLVVNLPLLVRGHSVQMRAYLDILQLRVPQLYKLQLSLPKEIEHEDAISFFDCKVRRLFVVAPVAQPKVVEVDATQMD